MITVTGRRTGKSITTPVNTVCVDGVLTVISMRSRTWWRNLRAGGTVGLRQAGKLFPVHAEVVEKQAEVAAWLIKYFMQYPGYAKYFQIRLGPDRKPNAQELEQLSSERVIIRLFPV